MLTPDELLSTTRAVRKRRSMDDAAVKAATLAAAAQPGVTPVKVPELVH